MDGGIVMRIEKKYHTQAAKEWEELVLEEEKRKAGLSEKERREEREHLHREADAIIRKTEEMDRDSLSIINRERIKCFSGLSTEAIRMAEILTLDIVVQTDGTLGRVRLSTDCFLINEMCSPTTRKILSNLIKNADDVWMRPEGELIVMEFVFDFLIKVPKE